MRLSRLTNRQLAKLIKNADVQFGMDKKNAEKIYKRMWKLYDMLEKSYQLGVREFKEFLSPESDVSRELRKILGEIIEVKKHVGKLHDLVRNDLK